MPVFNFPFSAVAAQSSFKLALILAAISPAIGGVLVSGPRGSAKSTLARGLADILVSEAATTAPFVTLPLGASEEMLVGTLDLQQVLQAQQVSFQAGLLAKAHGGVLYVDEVNLLSDHLVDLLLDVTASGTNIVERDGMSHRHDARFLLLGTMNPDEGALRPQLHDRFGFSVELDNQYSIDERVNIVRLREAFDANPQQFIAQYQVQQQALSKSILHARAWVEKVHCSDVLRTLIAKRCHEANVDGLRGDIVWYRAAVAHAAWQMRHEQPCDSTAVPHVTQQDIEAVEELVLAHRRQSPSSAPPPSGPVPTQPPPDNRPSAPNSSFAKPVKRVLPNPQSVGHDESPSHSDQSDWGSMPAQQQPSAHVEHRLAPLTYSATQPIRSSLPKESAAKVKYSSTFAAVHSEKGSVGALYRPTPNWFASLIANVGQWPLRQLRYHKARMSQPVLHMILLDTSASTLQQGLLANAKAAVLSIAEKAYLNRQHISIIGFGNEQVKILLPQQKAPKQLRHYIDSISAAGGTPLREVLIQTLQQQQHAYRRMPGIAIHTYLLTDGKTTQPFNDLHLLGDITVIDTEQATIKCGRAQQIAQVLGAHYIALPV